MAHDVTEPASRSFPVLAGSGWWLRGLSAAVAVMGLFLFANAARADEGNDGPVRFHEVAAWRGSLVATARANPATMAMHDELLRSTGGKGDNWNFQFNAFVSVDFLLDEYESDPSVWTGRVTNSEYSAGYHYFAHLSGRMDNDPDWKGYGEMEWNYEANGALDFSGDSRVELQFHRERGWSVRIPSGRLSTEARSYYFKHAPTKEEQNPEKDLIIDRDTTMRETIKVTATGMGGTENHPYPKTVSVLLGQSDKHEGAFPLIYGTMGVAPDVIWDYTVYLEPTVLEELRLVIEEPADYAIWRPETTPDTGAGPALEVTARVETAKGGAPKTEVQQFIWELVQTSKEPGVAMNWPLDAKDTRFDLDLDATGGYFKLSNEKQKLERAVQQGYSDTIKVVPYDWGGWSTLQVTAIMTDGRRVQGKVKGKSETGLRIPKRKLDSHIADGWKAKNKSGPDNLDDDNEPVGDGTKGDGLTLYEEYRGFYEDGVHIQGDSKTKDFFVYIDEAWIARPGVALFQQLTRLKVHWLLRADEFPESRVINANHRRSAHITDQHGVKLWINGNQQGFAKAYGGPGNPKVISSVGLMSDFAAFDSPQRKKIVAHELGHCVNICHHGELDEKVGWVAQDGKIFEISKAAPGGTEIFIVNEQYGDLTAGILEQLEQLPNQAITGYMGRDQGQHSGCENCIMRYHIAKTYVCREQPLLRFYGYVEPRPTRNSSLRLCLSAAGTGVNDPTEHKPQSRYGPAGLGNCLHQILVTDAVAAPRRLKPSPEEP